MASYRRCFVYGESWVRRECLACNPTVAALENRSRAGVRLAGDTVAQDDRFWPSSAALLGYWVARAAEGAGTTERAGLANPDGLLE